MKVRLLGSGSIQDESGEILLSFKKAYALLFYLIIEKTATREYIVNLLWGELSDDSAKKNLRNAVYVIRKTFNDQVILSPKRDILNINSDAFESVDVFQIENMMAEQILDLNDLTFLNGFHLKDAPYFDEWLSSQKYHFNEKIVKRIKQLVEISLDQKKAEDAEALCRKLLSFDEYDESAYRLLFRALELQGKFSAVASAYSELCEILNEELMLKPDDSTKIVFEEIMMVKSREESTIEQQMYGRIEEINELKASLYSHIKTARGKSVLLMGESGIGKSTIINAFYDQIEDQHTILQGRCYKAEAEFPLSPWFVMLESIASQVKSLPEKDQPACLEMVERITNSSDLITESYDERLTVNSYIVEKFLFELIDTLLKFKRIVLLFEDVQWMDILSLKLLIKLMGKGIYIVASVNTDYTPVQWHLDQFIGVQTLQRLRIKPFSKLETFEFIKMKQGHGSMSLPVLEKVYEESQGNPLFISEILNAYDWSEEHNALPGRVADVMQTRFNSLARDEQKVLNIASNFYDYFNYEDLKSISGMDEFIILDTLSQLVKKQMLEEVTRASELYFSFSHHIFREYVYNNLPLTVRRVYHMKIGQYLEKTSGEKPTLNRIYRLLYNFSMAKDETRELQYRIQFVSDYFDIAHEMFPVIGSHIHNDSEYASLIDMKEIHKEINKIESLYSHVKGEIKLSPEHEKMYFNYLRLVGRYHNIKGHIDVAFGLIMEMYTFADRKDNDQERINALLLMVHYYINIRDLNALDQTLNGAFIVAKRLNQRGIIGVLLRLKGYSKILEGRFDMGIRILSRAIEVFKSLEASEKYLLNIVGAHYYIGEGHRFRGAFEEAMEEYELAVNLCKEHGYKDKLAFLYGSMGQVYYEIEKFDDSKTYLESAKNLYDNVEGAWGRTMTMGYYSLILLRNKRYKETLKIIHQIDDSFENIRNPYHRALIYRIKGEICYYVKSNNINNTLTEYIECKDAKYCTKAIESFSQLNSTYEMELMEKMNALCSKCLNQL